MLCDRIALERHINVATQSERIQNSNHWILIQKTEGPQQPLLRQRRQSGTKPMGRRAIGILSMSQALTICDFSQS